MIMTFKHIFFRRRELAGLGQLVPHDAVEGLLDENQRHNVCRSVWTELLLDCQNTR